MILYLTGTGNTLRVARKLADRSGEKRIVDVLSATGRLRLEKDEPLGIFFPVHGWRPPRLLRSILSGLTIEGYSVGNYVYAVCTAGDTVGEAMRYLASDLRNAGFALDAAFDVRMPNTYVGLPFMDVDSRKVADGKLDASEHRLREIADKISARHLGEDLLYEGRWPRINSRLLGWLFAEKLVTDSRFRVVPSKCVGCGVCVKVCPARDIIMLEDGRPEWEHNKKCMTCFACYHNCPKHAIRYGWMTHGKGQYRLPQRQG